MINLIFYSLLGGLVSLIGGLLLTLHRDLAKKIITPLLSFASGAFLAVAFLDILPEALESSEEAHPILIYVLVGFLLFFILERLLMKYFYHRHNTGVHSDHTETLPLLIIIGDLFHNFLDGVLIGLSFLADPALGLTVTLGVAAHEIPQEIGDFSILLARGWSRKEVIITNVLQSLVTIPGALLGFYAGGFFDAKLPFMLAIVSGVFIYIAASDLIPEIHHKAGHKHMFRVVIPMLMSIGLIWYLITLTHN